MLNTTTPFSLVPWGFVQAHEVTKSFPFSTPFMLDFQTHQLVPPQINPLPFITNYFDIPPLGSCQTIPQQQPKPIGILPSTNYLAPFTTHFPSHTVAQPSHVRPNFPSHSIASLFPPPILQQKPPQQPYVQAPTQNYLSRQ